MSGKSLSISGSADAGENGHCPATTRAAHLRRRLNVLALDLRDLEFAYNDSDRQDEEARAAVRACKRAIRKAELELTALIADGAQ